MSILYILFAINSVEGAGVQPRARRGMCQSPELAGERGGGGGWWREKESIREKNDSFIFFFDDERIYFNPMFSISFDFV
jgi:hypothetical protein